MNILNFFYLTEGEWLIQQTVYILHLKQHFTQQGKLIIKEITNNNNLMNSILKELTNLNYQIKNIKIYEIIWNQNLDNSSIIVFFEINKYANNLITGIVYKFDQDLSKGKLVGNFNLQYNILKINFETKNLIIEEKIWLANPNLKLNTSIIKNNKGCTNIAFGSAIKVNSNL
uniref:Chromophore lyase CpcS/CpeS n=1 Tax=Rhodochaete parvula TaxID=110510 RepID=A0A1X9PV31_9RHOD|nr:chromophore lyase cpcS/cpeS [Rhodochaete parvula]ASK39559.1 hypothetical protein Rhodc_013 [Rhodochaete parvula]|eukprot:Plantae.Rhodophyta-Rhodochaete_pulchella.ctg29108.p1 GENE.Plantae.Rhodophyta-Rhodochaete_pulchella.ctg29108~~Plantae.Rhodophyta-Rhodochaete_pulchella.ctg29108.p1  ORF type:complete len:172 (+),score=1.77 Plantae.Rhodophyta-Rhodochaete_pulchella.ctg29108:254-769(+)